MLRKILTYGGIAGLVAGVPLSALVVWGDDKIAHSMAVAYALMLIALSAVFVAIKRQRDVDQGGVIGFWPAFGLGLAISAVAGIVYALAWETVTWLSGYDFAGTYANAMIAQQKAAGVGGAALAKVVAQAEDFKRSYANPLFRLPMIFVEIFPVGVLVSLISAGLLCNSRFLPARRE